MCLVPCVRSPLSLLETPPYNHSFPAPDHNPTRPKDGSAQSVARRATHHPRHHISQLLPPHRLNSLAKSGNGLGKMGRSRLDKYGSRAAEQPPPKTRNVFSILPPYVEPLHRGFKVFDKRREGPVNGCRTRDQDIIVAGLSMQRDNSICQRAQAPPCAIAAHRVANPAASCQTNPRCSLTAGAVQRLQHQTRCGPAPPYPCQTAEFRAPFKTLECRSHNCSLRLSGQPLTAARAASGKDPPTSFCRHSAAKPVTSFSNDPAGLKCTFHDDSPVTNFVRMALYKRCDTASQLTFEITHSRNVRHGTMT